MTREIKFRVWDEEQKLMLPDPNAGLVYGETVNQVFSDGDRVFMQFTGLLDRNGVEIYEGDLVRHNLRTTPLPVSFSEGAFVYVDNEAGLSIQCSVWDEREVIGNIYENGDLLK